VFLAETTNARLEARLVDRDLRQEAGVVGVGACLCAEGGRELVEGVHDECEPLVFTARRGSGEGIFDGSECVERCVAVGPGRVGRGSEWVGLGDGVRQSGTS
jgi:hypothetical protein